MSTFVPKQPAINVTPDRQVNQGSDQVSSLNRRLNLFMAGLPPFMEGVLVRGQAMTTGTNNIVTHNLGRQATGYLMLKTVSASGATVGIAHSWSFAQTGIDLLNQARILTSGGACTADIWFF